MSFVSINAKAIPENLRGLVNGDIVAGQLLFVELVFELVRIKFLPINQARILDDHTSLEYGREATGSSPS